MPRLACTRSALRRRRSAALLLLLGAALTGAGCQALFPTALPNGIVLREDAKIKKLAEADQFPSPSDVGLDAATSVP
jgi:hypothetical protein